MIRSGLLRDFHSKVTAVVLSGQRRLCLSSSVAACNTRLLPSHTDARLCFPLSLFLCLYTAEEDLSMKTQRDPDNLESLGGGSPNTSGFCGIQTESEPATEREK